ncbi:MAG: M16 family metallopeptidase [Rhodoferax sp.]
MKRTFLLLYAVLACAMAAHAQTPAPAPAVVEHILPNGLTVLIKPDHRAPTAVHMLWLRVGSMDEVDGASGLAHVLEHMLFKGSASLGPGEFSRRVAALGGRDNAFTSKDYTAYFQQVPASQLGTVMALEAERFATNQWSDAEFAKELEVVKEERRMRTDDSPQARLGELFAATQFLAHPYRRPIVGWMGDLDSLQPEDARAFYRAWYSPTNAALVVTGDVDPQAVLALAQQHYGTIANRATPVRKPRPEPVQQGARSVALHARAEQALVHLGWVVPGLSPEGLQASTPDAQTGDALALMVLSAVLSGYSGARLERALTQDAQRVADSASAHYASLGRGPSTFSLSAVPAPGRSAQEAQVALRAQVERVAREGVSEAELARVKNQWVAGSVYAQDSLFNQARMLGSLWTAGFAPDTNERLIERLRAVTGAQVQAVAQRYFADTGMTVATLVPDASASAPTPRRAVATGMRH